MLFESNDFEIDCEIRILYFAFKRIHFIFGKRFSDVLIIYKK